VCAAALLLPGAAHADALVRTQAMKASTIAEFYVEEERVELELEIGLVDLEAFGNMMPDEIWERLGNEPEPLADRFARFVSEDLFIADEEGGILPARILEMKPRERIRRDEITGEPLAAGDEEPETVVFARLEFLVRGQPEALTIAGAIATRAGIGFVLYHEKIAVNDFRYLAQSQTVKLDWIDPWYSAFEGRALRRAYFAPMSGFIYVEPYEVRKEIIVRPKDLQCWLDLGLEGRRTIPVEIQDELKRSVAEFLRQHHAVTIDGEAVTPDLAQINFLERTLKSSRVIDPPEEIDLNGAILGAIFVYPTEGLPQNVKMEWDLFNEKIRIIPVSAVDQAGPLPSFLEPDYNVLEWQNFLKNPVLPTMAVLTPPPGLALRAAAWLRWPAAVLSVLLAAWCVLGLVRRAANLRSRVVLAIVLLLATSASFWLGRGALPSRENTVVVVSGLLHNIYRAFDFRDEEQIYDVLANSVEGDLLTRIYLETRKGLELANQGGARAKVKEIELIDLEARAGDNGGFVATATWNVGGSVGHWGHVHQRRNQYRAELAIEPVDAVWKLTGIEILEEQRL
jgi:hypothetical protein